MATSIPAGSIMYFIMVYCAVPKKKMSELQRFRTISSFFLKKPCKRFWKSFTVSEHKLSLRHTVEEASQSLQLGLIVSSLSMKSP